MKRATALFAASVLAASTVTALVSTASASPPSGHGARSEHQRIVDYWTPQRRANAIPRDVVLPLRGKPGGGDGVVTGATWTDSSSPVVKTTGKVYFHLGRYDWVCSGSAINSGGNVNLVLTAGHCVWDDSAGWASEWLFWPGYSNGTKPYGDWTATALFTTGGWHSDAGDYGNDWPNDAGIAVVEGDTTASLAARLGVTLPTMDTSGNYADLPTYTALGYPAAQKYKGGTLTYCQGPAQLGWDGDNTVSLACDMTGGSSGGPMYDNATPASGHIKSLNSYGYSGVKRMFGPTFDSAEQAMRQSATDGSCNGNEVCDTQ